MKNTPAKQVRSILVKQYWRNNVRCVNGSGTAWGWVNANVTQEKPDNCYCEELKKDSSNVSFYRSKCTPCKEKYEAVKEKINELVKDVEFYHYYPDDFSDTEKRREFLLDINLV